MAAKGITLPIIFKSDDSGLKKAASDLNGFGKTVGKIGGLIAGAFAIRGIVNFGQEAIAAAEGVATANARIEQIAKSTALFGSATQEVTNRMIEFAEANELRIATDAEVIKGVQGQLLSFKALGAGADEAGGAFDRATIAAFDMAAAGFGSAESNAIALGKALEDPIRGLTALRRSGTTFTEQQQEQIKTLVESGDLLGAQNLILTEIEAQYGGVAAATANASEKFEILKGNLTEAVGLPLLNIFNNLIEDLIPVFEEIIVAVGDAMVDLGPVLTEIAGMIPGLVQALIPLIPIIGQVAAIFFELVEMILPYVVQFLDLLLPIIEQLLPPIMEMAQAVLPPLVEIFFLLLEALMPIIQEILPILTELILVLAPIIVSLIEAFLPLIELVLPLLVGFIEFLIPILQVVAEIIGILLVEAISWLVEAFGNITETIGVFTAFFEEAFGGVKEFFYGIVNSLIGMFEGFINGAIRGINTLISGINKLQWKVPSWVKGIGGQTFGFNIPTVPEVTLPRIALAEGGIVTQPTTALIGEAGPEAVIPLSKAAGMGSTYNITVQAGVGDPVSIGREVVTAIKRFERANGPVFASA